MASALWTNRDRGSHTECRDTCWVGGGGGGFSSRLFQKVGTLQESAPVSVHATSTYAHYTTENYWLTGRVPATPRPFMKSLQQRQASLCPFVISCSVPVPWVSFLCRPIIHIPEMPPPKGRSQGHVCSIVTLACVHYCPGRLPSRSVFS